MLKATPSRIPLNKFKTKNRKNKFKTLKGRKKKPFLLIQGPRFTDKRQRSKILTDFRQSNRILTDNRQVDPHSDLHKLINKHENEKCGNYYKHTFPSPKLFFLYIITVPGSVL